MRFLSASHILSEAIPELVSIAMLPVSAAVTVDAFRRGDYFLAGVGALCSATFIAPVYEGIIRGKFFEDTYGLKIDPLKIVYEKIKPRLDFRI